MTQRKRALVSGASSGIGRATALRLARDGWDVCATALDADGLEEVRPQLGSGDHLVQAADYSSPAQVAVLEELIARRWGRLDALVSCAGVYASGDPIQDPLEQWRRPLDVMLNGAIHLTRLAVPLLRDGGRIVHVTSIHGVRVERGGSAYAIAKGALNQYCRALALELSSRGILVNAIAPGFVDTPMAIVDGKNELESELFRSEYVEGHHLPLKRAAKPEEIAGVASFLLGPDASYITGQVITVDGGLTITF
jgi:NAD(P)-dependent dehydrogenase (short-subunit alcohol dehydrogenase family)